MPSLRRRPVRAVACLSPPPPLNRSTLQPLPPHSEHVVECSSGLLVCRISGTVRDDLAVSHDFGAGGAGDDDDGAGGAGGGDDGGLDFGGRLARAFELGYYAESLEECETLRFASAGAGGGGGGGKGGGKGGAAGKKAGARGRRGGSGSGA